MHRALSFVLLPSSHREGTSDGARALAVAALFTSVAVLASCGAGGAAGGGGGNVVEPPQVAASPCVATASVPGASVISGTARYELIGHVTSGADAGALDYNNKTLKPIRGATAQLIDGAGAAIASCTTDETTGTYAFVAPGGSGALKVRVRAELLKTAGSGGTWNFTVRDNTRGNALYTLDSAAFTPVVNVDQTVNVQAGAGTFVVNRGYTATRAAAPFAILDVMFSGMKKVLSALPNADFPQLQALWSTNNRPSSGLNFAIGDIRTTSYFASESPRTLVVLGTEDVDTDEFDTHVVEHEWGHYFQDVFSRDDSVGFDHNFGDRLDMRVAFSEGWGYGWAGLALNDPVTADASGPNQAEGFEIHAESLPSANDRGWYSESTVLFLIFQFGTNTNIGFPALFRAMNGAFKTGNLPTAIHNFADKLKAEVGANGDTAINGLLQQVNINPTDAFGTNEANDGDVPESLPVFRDPVANSPHCVTNAADPFQDTNKLGESVFIRITGRTGIHTLRAQASGSVNTDPDFFVHLANGTTQRAESGTANIEQLSVNLGTDAAAVHVVELFDANLFLSGGRRCFTFTVN